MKTVFKRPRHKSNVHGEPDTLSFAQAGELGEDIIACRGRIIKMIGLRLNL